MVKKENTKMKVIEILEDMFRKHKISAFMFIPGIGTVSLITNDHGKLALLEHSRTELISNKVNRENKAIEWFRTKANREMLIEKMENGNDDKQEKPFYVG